MAEEDYYSNTSMVQEVGARIRDLEEKQRIIKDRLLLIGQNLVEIRERNNEDMAELKKEVELIKQDLTRIKDFVENISYELSNFARKDELAILSKQAKMFQPLDLVSKEELKKILKTKKI